MYRKQHGKPQMNELRHLSTLFSWLGSRCLLGEGERADSCLLQPCTVITLLAVILWEPVSCHHCVGLPVVSPPHSSASWSLAITCKSSAAFWGLCDVSDGLSKPVIAFHVGQLFSTLSFKSRVLVYPYLRWWSLWTSYFTPSVLPWRTNSVRIDWVFHRTRNTTQSHVLWMTWQLQHFCLQWTTQCYSSKEETVGRVYWSYGQSDKCEMDQSGEIRSFQ